MCFAPDTQAQEEQHRLHRSPSWQLAEELAQAMGAFSVAACKTALEKVSNDANAAAIWLLEQGAQLEAELAEEAEAAASASSEPAHSDTDDEVQVRTASFRPVTEHSQISRAVAPPRHLSRGSSVDSTGDQTIDVDEVRAPAV